MNKTIDALKLAEEAMTSNMRLLSAKALAAIREALAEQEKQEPLKRPPNCGTGYCSCIECPYEPVKQEPVAVVDEIGKRLDGTNIFNAIGKVDVGQPLYAAPVSEKREWVDLTCQEVTALIMEGAAGGGWQGFAERVQAAYKEKNNG